MKNGWEAKHYIILRFILGFALLLHFVELIPWASLIFSNQGMVPDANVSPLTKAFPNIISIFDDPFAINLFNFSGILASILFMLGFKSRVSGLWIWYIFACYVGRNPLINNPGLSFLGWILIANCFIPSAPSIFSLSSKSSETLKSEWKLPDNLFLVFWIVTSLAYGYSGFTKLGSPSWLDGSAVHEAMYLPLARPSLLRDFMLQLPLPIFMGLTWGSLALELFYGFLAFSKKLRPVIWFLMISMHLGLLVLMQFAELSIAMILFQFFLFDPDWVKSKNDLHNDLS